MHSKTLENILVSIPPDHCGLEWLTSRMDLPRDLQESIQAACRLGWTLRSHIPGIDPGLLTDWAGHRLWLVHRARLKTESPWSSIVSSRWNRSDTECAEWPRWIELAMRKLTRDNKTLLIIPGTTIARMVSPLAQCLPSPALSLRVCAAERSSLGHWLTQSLAQALAPSSVAMATLWVSPAHRPCSDGLTTYPLADRLSFVLAHTLLALTVRPGGNMASLMARRLQDSRFSAGTTSLRVEASSRRAHTTWLDRRLVGWYVPASRQPQVSRNTLAHRALADRRQVSIRSANSRQWTAPMRLIERWEDYLAHCVRGTASDRVQRVAGETVLDAVLDGTTPERSPLHTLWTILAAGRLRASDRLLRSSTSAVSFSAVPLPALLSRRRYQAHLGRWDWEPYGLLIRRQVLEQMGARPVIYGDERLFDSLRFDERQFFQPAHRRSARMPLDQWQAEQEWRILDDVRLYELPSNSLILFVATSSEAQTLAGLVPWPVIWQQADRNDQRPAAAKRRQRNRLRTSTN